MANPKNAPGVPAPANQAFPVLPDDMLEIAAQDAGLGISTDPADQILPRISVGQPTTPAVMKNSADYIADAVPGCFLFHNDLIPVRDGVVGFVCIPCDMQTAWLEFGPTRGGGFFGHYLQRPADAVQRPNQEGGPRRPQWVRENGNQLQQVREFIVLVEPALKPYLLPFHGTGHTTARKWQTHMAQFLHPQTGGTLPAYSRKYRLFTKPESNSLGHWYGIQFEDRGWVSKPEYDRARELHKVIARGAYRIDMGGAEAAA